MPSSSKKQVSTELDFVHHTKRYERFDSVDLISGADKNPIVKNFYIKQGAVEFDPETERIEVTVKVIKKKKKG